MVRRQTAHHEPIALGRSTRRMQQHRREYMTFGTKGFLAGISMIAMLAAAIPGVRANDSLIKAQADSNQWAVAGHDYGNTRFSPLKQINTENAGKLTLVYSFSLASLRSNEASPIVVCYTFYVSTSWGPKYV